MQEPQSLPGARVAWDAPMTDAGENMRATVYAMKVDNPRSDVAIETMDLEILWHWVEHKQKGKSKRYDSRTQIAVLAVTLGHRM